MSSTMIRYGSALFLILLLTLGVYMHWWAPAVLESVIVGGLTALGIFHSVNYGAINLTGTPPKSDTTETKP